MLGSIQQRLRSRKCPLARVAVHSPVLFRALSCRARGSARCAVHLPAVLPSTTAYFPFELEGARRETTFAQRLHPTC